MTWEQILAELRGLDGVLELVPQPGSEHPEISWGDHFYYFAPDGVVPTNRQPYATIVTKDYPGDTASRLGDGRWRLNVHVGQERFVELVGVAAEDVVVNPDEPVEADVFVPHPHYGTYGWVAVVEPGERTTEQAVVAIRAAHADDRRRVERRGS